MTTVHDSWYPGASMLNSMAAPRRNAATPPRPRFTVGLKVSDDQEGDPQKHLGHARVLYNFVHDGWARAAFSTSTMDGLKPGLVSYVLSV